MSRLAKGRAVGLLLVLAVLVGGWFLLVAPARSEAAALRVQADEQQVANARARTQLQVLQAQADALPEQRARLAEVAAKIPSTPRLARLVRALSAAARDSDVELVSLVPGVPAPAVPGASAADPAAGPVPVAGTTPAGPAGTLHSLPITINVVGGYYEIERYLAALEDLPRALRVTGLAVAPGANPVAAPTEDPGVDDGRSLAAVITGSVYLAKGQADLPVAPPVEAGPAGEPPGAAGVEAPADGAAPAPADASRVPAPGSAPNRTVE